VVEYETDYIILIIIIIDTYGECCRSKTFIQNDTYIRSSFPTTNLDDMNILWLQNTSTIKARNIIKRNLTYPATSVINKSLLYMYYTNSGDGNIVSVYNVTSGWSETGVTWNTMPSNDSSNNNGSVTIS